MPEVHYALITGASSGIGECFARALAARGQNVVLVARSNRKLDALADELARQHPVLAQPVAMDLSVPGAAGRLAEHLRERKLPIELLVNNAGFGAQGEFWKLSLGRQAEMLRLNIQALVELTYLLLPPLIKAHRGGILNVSSTAGFQPVPYTSVYAASKAFVTTFSLGLARELRAYGVAVVTLCPGGTATNFFDAGQYQKRSFAGGLQSPEAVVEAGLKALDHGGGLVVPRMVNKLSIFSQRFVPRGLVTRVAARMFRPRRVEDVPWPGTPPGTNDNEGSDTGRGNSADT